MSRSFYAKNSGARIPHLPPSDCALALLSSLQAITSDITHIRSYPAANPTQGGTADGRYFSWWSNGAAVPPDYPVNLNLNWTDLPAPPDKVTVLTHSRNMASPQYAAFNLTLNGIPNKPVRQCRAIYFQAYGASGPLGHLSFPQFGLSIPVMFYQNGLNPVQVVNGLLINDHGVLSFERVT